MDIPFFFYFIAALFSYLDIFLLQYNPPFHPSIPLVCLAWMSVKDFVYWFTSITIPPPPPHPSDVLTLDVWHGFLVLVLLTTEDGEGQPLQHLGPLLEFLFLGAEQVQRAGLGDAHTT